jgi:FGGY-family pentulose kinase
VKGLGFDATCSLVALDKSGNSLSVSPSGNDQQNVILWLDHRASEETAQINRLNHSVLKYVGGKISLEMETPKLLWLKKHLPNQWDKAGSFFDLPDFLTWKATGSESRSLCSLVCKWTYEITTDGGQGWNLRYFQDIGLGDLQENNWNKIGNVVLPPGTPVGEGLSARAASELGLKVGTPVGTSIIDAHAGGLGLVGCRVSQIDSDFSTRLSKFSTLSRKLFMVDFKV